MLWTKEQRDAAEDLERKLIQICGVENTPTGEELDEWFNYLFERYLVKEKSLRRIRKERKKGETR
jgi:hypothetical protein